MKPKKIEFLKLLWDKNLTQAELCHISGFLNESRLSRLLNGYLLPSDEEMNFFCNFFECSLEEVEQIFK